MKTRKRVLGIILTLALTAGLLAFVPVPASAANQTVNILQSDTVAQIQTKIQDAINASGHLETVTVTGSKTGAATTLLLDIPSGRTVIWKASYSGSADKTVYLRNTGGIIEVAAGGTINSTGGMALSNESAAQVRIEVNGGTVTNTTTDTNGYAIFGGQGDVVVTGGMVQSNGEFGKAIGTSNGAVSISGGTVQANGRYGEAIHASVIIRISGGTVQANGFGGQAVEGGNITVTGGKVQATGTNGCALAITSGDGAYLTGTCTGSYVAGPASTIVAVDTISVPVSRHGTSIGITTTAGTSPASWACYGTNPMLLFDSGGALVWGDHAPETPTKGIFGTNAKWYGEWWHYVLFFIGFGFIWMWF